MWLLLATFGYAILSALVPVLNVEAWVLVAAADTSAPALLLVGAASVGQMIGKIVWYYSGERLERFPWFRKKFAKESWRTAIERWRGRTEGRPWATAGLILLSSFTGIPPFAVIAVIAGLLRTNVVVFFVAGLVGRFARFWIVLEAGQYAWFLL